MKKLDESYVKPYPKTIRYLKGEFVVLGVTQYFPHINFIYLFSGGLPQCKHWLPHIDFVIMELRITYSFSLAIH